MEPYVNISQNLDKLKDIEKVVDDYIIRRKGNFNNIIQATQYNLDTMSNGQIRFKVHVVEPKSRSSFIMGVYPDVNELKKRTEPLINALNNGDEVDFLRNWRSIPLWHIEIDARTFRKNSNIRFDNGGQYVAILCHEIGHINHTHPIRLINNYKLRKGTFSLYEKTILKNPVLGILFLPMLVGAAGLKIVLTKPFSEAKEISADLSIPDEYKPYLIDYTEKHIIPYANNPSILVSEGEFDNDQNTQIEFSHNCIKLMKKRRAALTIAIKNQYKTSESPYFKAVCATIAHSLTSEDLDTENIDMTRDRYLGESFERCDRDALRESEFVLETIRVSERDILLLSAQSDTIKTIDDKAYLINTICDFEESLIKQKSKAAKKLKNLDEIGEDPVIDPKLKQLAAIKTKVMNTPVYTGRETYGVYIKYPDGYEG